MRLYGHTLLSPLLFLPQPIIGNVDYLYLAVLASIFIDVDHVQLLFSEKAFSFSKVRELYKNIYKNYSKNPNIAYKKVFYLFHTIEFNIFLLLISLFWTPVAFIVLGFMFHILCDIIHHRINGMPILRWLFFYNFLKVNEIV